MSTPTLYRFGDFELDRARRCLRRGHDEIHLRPKVFDVLLRLIHHRDRVVGIQELVTEVWKDTAVTDDVVYRCVIDIRTALNDDRKQPQYIKTIPKTGYRFVAPVEEASVNGGRALTPPEIAAPRPAAPSSRRWIWVAGILIGSVAALLIQRKFSTPTPAATLDEAAWWRLDEGSGRRAGDASKGGLHAAIAGEATWIDGKIGKAIRFDGKGQVEGQDSERRLPRGALPRTMTAWVRTSTSAADETNILRYGQPGWPDARFIHLYLARTGHAGFGFGFVDGIVRSTTRVADSQWHFVAGVYEGERTNAMHIYVDGVREASRNLPRRPTRTTIPNGPWAAGWRATPGIQAISTTFVSSRTPCIPSKSRRSTDARPG